MMLPEHINKEKTTIQFLTFFIENNIYGIEITDVKEVNVDFDLIPIFHAPKGIKGQVNLRGQIYLIFDLHLALRLTDSNQNNKGKIILIKERIAGQSGIIVDEIGEVVTVDIDDIEYTSAVGKEDAEHHIIQLASGICKLKDQLIIILNVNNLLEITKNQ